ncbi:MAG: site-specific integrase [Acidobacteria bacterium]|nr:site-specific integrase [Acidobacteriota bacterium]
MNGSVDYRPDRPRPWRARYTGPDGRQHSKSWRTKVEAQRWLRAEIGKIDRGDWMDPAGGMQLLSDYALAWLARRVKANEKTKEWYDGILRSRVLPIFGEYQLRRIDAASIRGWVTAMMDDGLSPARIRHSHQVVRSILNQAVGDGLIGSNPATDISLPREHAREMLSLTPEQLRDLARHADTVNEGEGTLITFLGYSGLRWGELIALRVRSVDLMNGRIQVKDAATEVGGRLVFGPPKNHRQRVVILPKSVVRLLEGRLASAALDDLAFTAPEGGPLRNSNYRKNLWLPAVAALAVEHPHLVGLRIHDLRHTAASLAISSNANIKVVQRMLGHKHASMTLDRYGHLFTEDLEALADRLDEVYRRAA